MFAHARLRALFVAMSVSLALGATACSPVLPPPAPRSVAMLTAIAPLPALATSEPSSSEGELARAKLLYPYNLPQYDGLAAEIAAATAQRRQPGASPPPVVAE